MKLTYCLAVVGCLALSAAAGSSIPLPEHPRPDFARAEWQNLNGAWRFRFDPKDEGLSARWFAAPDADFPLTINVPFGWGSPLSGVKDESDVAWYRRDITVPAAWKGRRVFLVFDACDHDATVYVGSARVGLSYLGGVPFEVDITEFVPPGTTRPLTVRVWDYPMPKEQKDSWRLTGKQGYGNVRGIWQTVRLEARPDTFLASVRFTPHLATGSVTAEAELSGPAKQPLAFEVAFPNGEAKTASVAVPVGALDARLEIKLDVLRPWSPDDPYLYEAVTALRPGANARIESAAPAEKFVDAAIPDVVSTYFGLREIGIGKLPGTDFAYVTLNGRPLYLQLALDQSYTTEGYYTFSSDDYMRREIEIAKAVGLTGIRTHIKTEVPRKLYWADRLGVLVMADVPCGWCDPHPLFFAEHEATFREMVRRDFNHPSVFSWVLFNESWGLKTRGPETPEGDGQRHLRATSETVAAAWRKAKALDPTRLIEDVSPCNNDHVVSDLNTFHLYLQGPYWAEDIADLCKQTYPGSTWNYIGGYRQGDVPLLNSECGDVWGYEGSTGDVDFSWDYHQMMDAFRRNPRCAGWVYTEHHDVLNEWNGYVRADRTWKETGLGELFPGMSLRDWHAPAYLAVGETICRAAKADETVAVPVDLSLMTDALAGRKLALDCSLAYFDARGEWLETPWREVHGFTAAAWQQGRLCAPSVRLPDATACGVIRFALRDGEKIVARNFTCFQTKGAEAARTVSCRPDAFAKAEWSLRSWTVLAGRKANGAGSGFFEYAFTLPAGAKRAVFRAEVATKRLNGKDRVGAELEKKEMLDFFVYGGTQDDPSGLPNSYPMTDEKPSPGRVKVLANGVEVATVALPDEPADHRGILSWTAQKQGEPRLKGHLDEAGGYGYLVRAEIPESVVAAAKDGVVTVRLVAEEATGLAVYGAETGRMPFDPNLEWE